MTEVFRIENLDRHDGLLLFFLFLVDRERQERRQRILQLAHVAHGDGDVLEAVRTREESNGSVFG